MNVCCTNEQVLLNEQREKMDFFLNMKSMPGPKYVIQQDTFSQVGLVS